MNDHILRSPKFPIVALTLLLIPILAARGDSPSPATDPIAALRLLASGHAENLAKIGAYSIETTDDGVYRVQEGTDTYENHGVNKERRQGDLVYVERTGHLAWTAQNGYKGDQRIGERYLVNSDERFLASWTIAHGFVNVYKYKSLDTLGIAARSAKHRASPEGVVYYGLGTGDDTFRDFANEAMADSAVCVDVQRSGVDSAGDLYTVKTRSTDGEPTPMEVTVDAGKGCLITRTVKWSRQRIVLREINVTLAEVAPSVWFPKEWQVTNYEPTEQPNATPPVRSRNTVKVTSFAMNKSFARAEFSIAAMEPRADVEFVCYDKASVPTSMLFVDDRLVPYSPELYEQQVKRAAASHDSHPAQENKPPSSSACVKFKGDFATGKTIPITGKCEMLEVSQVSFPEQRHGYVRADVRFRFTDGKIEGGAQFTMQLLSKDDTVLTELVVVEKRNRKLPMAQSGGSYFGGDDEPNRVGKAEFRFRGTAPTGVAQFSLEITPVD